MVRHIWTCHQLVERGSLHPHGVPLLYTLVQQYTSILALLYATSTLLYTSHQSTLVHFQFTDTGTPLLAQQYTCTKVEETINCSQVNLHCLPLSRIALQCTTLQSQDTEAGYLVWAGIHQQLHGEEGSRGQGKGRGLLVLQNFSTFSVELPTCTFQLYYPIVLSTASINSVGSHKQGNFKFCKTFPFFRCFFPSNTFQMNYPNAPFRT